MRGQDGSGPGAAGAGALATRPLTDFVAWLTSLDAGDLTDRERVEALGALQQAAAAIGGAQADLTAAYADSQRALGGSARGVATEVGLARRVGLARAMDLVRRSRVLTADLPCVRALLRAGAVDEHRALVVADRVSALDPVAREMVDAAVAEDLARLSDAEVRAAVERAVAEQDPAAHERRCAEALTRRHVSVRPAPDGMADLAIHCSALDAAAAIGALGAHADAVLAGVGGLGAIPEAAEGRGREAIMTDAALAWLSGRDGYEGPTVEVQLVMAESALFAGPRGQRSSSPAHVVGVGPVPAPAARRLIGRGARGAAEDRLASRLGGTRAGESAARESRAVREERRVTLRRVWASADGLRLTAVESRRRVVPPDVRAPLDAEAEERAGPGGRLADFHDRLRRPPHPSELVALDSADRCFTGGLRRFVELRDQCCRAPFCGARIRHIDHVVPYRESPETTAAGGMGLCVGHNLAKEDGGHCVQVESDGLGATPHEVGWRTPAGRTYRSVAPPVLGWGTTTEAQHREPEAASPLESALESRLAAA